MHYIRFLKSPKVIRSKSSYGLDVLSAKLTVTTDLGEAFLMEDIQLIVELLDKDANIIGKSGKALWKGKDGMRSLEVNFSIPKTKALEGVRMSIRPFDQTHSTATFVDVIGLRSKRRKTPLEGGVVAVRSPLIDLKTGQSTHSGLAERNFIAQDGTEISIWEETGESIARHIWYASRDAGLVFSAYISVALPLHPSPLGTELLPSLPKTLVRGDLNVLELGAGCGIVGITLSTLSSTPNQQFLLTDLPEASEILEHNISTSSSISSPSSPIPYSKLTHQILDWSQPLSTTITSTKWNLILIADCTYNPDVVPDLVATLSRLRDVNPDLEIVVAMKIRHESESVFFDLMREGRFEVSEHCKFPLPVLGGEDEEIEIFVFVDGMKLGSRVGR